MKKNSLSLLMAVIFTFACLPLGSAEATSLGNGTLSLNLNLSYDPTQIQWLNQISSLEDWPIGEIFSPYPDLVAFDMHDIYDTSPGWTPVPAPISVNSGGSSVNITSAINPLNVFNPSGTSQVQVVGYISTDPAQYNYCFSDIQYYAGLHAIGSGSFTLTLDYQGTWTGNTDLVGDYVGLSGNVQAQIYQVERDTSNEWIYTDVGHDGKYVNLFLNDGQDGSINNYAGQLSFVVNFEQGDDFYIATSGANYLNAFSIKQTPAVPVPATMLLFGSGLAGLAGLKRNRKK